MRLLELNINGDKIYINPEQITKIDKNPQFHNKVKIQLSCGNFVNIEGQLNDVVNAVIGPQIS